MFWVPPPRIRIQMEKSWDQDPDPHKNRCGSATLLLYLIIMQFSAAFPSDFIYTTLRLTMLTLKPLKIVSVHNYHPNLIPLFGKEHNKFGTGSPLMDHNKNKLQFCIIASLCVLYTVLYFCVPYTVLYRYIVNEVRPRTKLSSLV